MVEVLVIPDGATEDPAKAPTSLELARTPMLDVLSREGAIATAQTTPAGMRPGSEVGIPTLLGAELAQPPSRGLIEAAAAGVDVPAGMSAWRIDVPRSLAGDESLVQAGRRHGLIHLRAHRWLAIGLSAPTLPKPWTVWPGGGDLPRMLDSSTTVITARGAASGCARLLGARVVVPNGATGDTDTDYGAKVLAALNALADAARVVVHLGGPDEASHRGDRLAKIRSLEVVDECVLRPLTRAIVERRGILRVCPDHGTDVETGEHLGGAVPVLSWGPDVSSSGPDLYYERAILEEVRE
jgi:2,3-bisphosphoglycerate-independent phosphoglycerate mutase